MKIKLKDYIKEIEYKLENNKVDKDLADEIYTWIIFFQHERLVHLIVTFLTALSTIIFLLGTLYFEEVSLLVLFLLSLSLFAPYIFHYYNLENGVQRLYDLYFDTKKATNK